MIEEYFFQDERLGIPIPNMDKNWNDYNTSAQHSILFKWETIRGRIPDRIAMLEKEINQKLDELADENDFMRCCRLNNEVAELASVINDLWLWYRTHENIMTNKLEH